MARMDELFTPWRAMYRANVYAMISSSRATRNVHSLPPLPLSARICGCEQASITIGTPSSFTTGIAPRQAPLCVWPMITSTWSTSTSLRTALTASPGCALLSAKKASSLRPMTPPLALISSTASVAPQRTPSPVIAAGPLIAEAKPMRIGGAWAPAETAMRSSVATASTGRMMAISSLSDDREVLARARQRSRAARRDFDRVLDLHAAPAVLVIGRLHAEDHAGLERGVGRRVDRRRVVRLETDAVADVVALIVRQPAFARHAHGDVEELAHRHAGLHSGDGGALTGQDCGVIACLLLARRAEDRRARNVRSVRADETTEVEPYEVARTQRSIGGVNVGECCPLADRHHGEERLGALAEDFLFVHTRRLALGDAGLQHA